MIGLGTIINTAAIAAAGAAGGAFGKLFTEEKQDAIYKACGISVLFLGIGGAMEGILQVDGASVTSGRAMFVVLCLALGTMIGEVIGIEDAFERFGEWLKRKSGNSGDRKFVEAFVNTSFTVCIGAMAILGSIEDGISGDYSTLAVKSVLDFIIVMVMSSSMGKGCAFSAIPVFLLQGSVTLFARFLAPVMTAGAVANLSLVGSILIFCVGVNLVWGKKVRVANMLPAVLLAVLADYLPFGL